MPQFKVAHVREQGQNMIIFPLNGAFGHQSPSDQQDELAALEYQANMAGLAGSAVAVWQDGSGSTRFLGPAPWRSFLQGLSYRTVLANVNKAISW
jgi:hypothetical protein